MTERNWDHSVDFLIVGSGGGGMCAGIAAADLGLDALIIEKGKKFGGSTAISGGGIWIPNAPTLVRKGAGDDPAAIRDYLRTLTAGTVPEARIEAYVDAGPKLMQLLDRSPHMKMYWVKGYSDYHPEDAGGSALGRTIECLPFDTRKLKEDEQFQRPNSMKGPLGLWVTSKDYHDLAMVKRTWKGRKASLVATWRVGSNVFRRRHMATGGRALAARLRMMIKDAGIPLWLRTSMIELVTDTQGVVIGVVAEREGKTIRIGSRLGVLLATGGFDHNQRMRDHYLPEGGRADISAGARENTGDGIRVGQELGAAVDLMDDAWWMPSVLHPMGAVIPLVSERCIPLSMIVNARGERFTNESSPYVNFVHDQLAGGHVPAWFVMDSKAKNRYPFAQVLPNMPFPQGFYDSGVVHRADTPAELAVQIGMPADRLAATVARFNGFARDGRDADGSAIEGLYATGNTTASVMGNEYAGAGATIGPSMVFGFLAVKYAAGHRLLLAGASAAPNPG